MPTSGSSTVSPSSTTTYTLNCNGATDAKTVTVLTQCADEVDNDGDGQVDLADAGCSSSSDNDERNACTDGVDNDGDGKVDHTSSPLRGARPPDPGCSSLQDNSEADPPVFIEIPPE